MFRFVAGRVVTGVRSQIVPKSTIVGAQVRLAHGKAETDEEFDDRYEKFFSRPDIDAWEIRKAMNDLAGMDLVPEPRICVAALKACRRLNDYALAIRFIESLKFKCGPYVDTIFPYLMQEMKPCMDELGINTLEEMGYDKPELALQNVYDIH